MVILVAVFVGKGNAQVSKFFCWLIAKDRNKIRNIPKDYMSVFDNTNQCVSAITELCYAVITLAVQAYNAVLSASKIQIKFLASDK